MELICPIAKYEELTMINIELRSATLTNVDQRAS